MEADGLAETIIGNSVCSSFIKKFNGVKVLVIGDWLLVIAWMLVSCDEDSDVE